MWFSRTCHRSPSSKISNLKISAAVLTTMHSPGSVLVSDATRIEDWFDNAGNSVITQKNKKLGN